MQYKKKAKKKNGKAAGIDNFVNEYFYSQPKLI
jgi:hypothetical protein